MGEEKENNLSLKKWALINIICLGVIIIPTIVLLIYFIETGTPVSKYIANVWRTAFYTKFGLNYAVMKVFLKSIFAIIAVLMTFSYYKGYKLLSSKNFLDDIQEKRVFKEIFLWFLIFGLILFFVIPFHSSDLFGYINRGSQQAFYNLNPYIYSLNSVPGWRHDLMFHIHWINNPAPYGFFFIFFTKAICLLSGKHFFMTFLLFKAVNFVLFSLTGLLIFIISKKLNLKRPWLNAYLFLWNPLLLLHSIGNAHNDIMLAFFLLSSVGFLTTVRFKWASLPLLIISILVKYASLLALPFIIIYLFMKKQWRALIYGGLISVVIFVLLGLMYVPDIIANPAKVTTLKAIAENAGVTVNSLHSAIYKLFAYSSKLIVVFQPLVKPFGNILKSLLWIGFIGFYFVLVASFFRNLLKNRENKNHINYLLEVIALSMLIMIVFISSKFYAWYICMFFPLLLLLDEANFIRRFGILLSVFLILSFTPIENMNILDFITFTVVPLVICFKVYKPQSSLFWHFIDNPFDKSKDESFKET